MKSKEMGGRRGNYLYRPPCVLTARHARGKERAWQIASSVNDTRALRVYDDSFPSSPLRFFMRLDATCFINEGR